MSVKQWRNRDRAAGSLEGTVKGGSGSLEWSGSGRNLKKKGFVMINSDHSGILRKANSFPLIASLQHLTQHLQRNPLSAERLLRIFLAVQACVISPGMCSLSVRGTSKHARKLPFDCTLRIQR